VKFAKPKFIALTIGLIITLPAWAATHVLTGNDLTVDTLWEMSKPGEKVTISPEGWDRINKSYQAILDATKNGISVYGVSVNYGDLKHQQVVNGDVEKEPNRSASIKFNERQMRIQAAGLKPWLDNQLVKMSMIIRLNQMASGITGMTKEAANAYMNYINNDV
jgi:phenylalanine and histidine ammonia-lyase